MKQYVRNLWAMLIAAALLLLLLREATTQKDRANRKEFVQIKMEKI